MMTGMDSQFIANLISGISALATVVAAIYTRRQAIGGSSELSVGDRVLVGGCG